MHYLNLSIAAAVTLAGCVTTATVHPRLISWNAQTYAHSQELWERFSLLGQQDRAKQEQLKDVMDRFYDVIPFEQDKACKAKLILLLRSILDGWGVPDVHLRSDPALDAKLTAEICVMLRDTSIEETMRTLSSAIGVECAVDPATVHATGWTYGTIDLRVSKAMEARTVLWWVAAIYEWRYVLRHGKVLFLPSARYGSIEPSDGTDAATPSEGEGRETE